MKTPITRSPERDAYILAQALHIAIQTLRAVPHPRREVSNIRDMELMLDTLWPSYKALFAQQDAAWQAHELGWRPQDGDPQAWLDKTLGKADPV